MQNLVGVMRKELKGSISKPVLVIKESDTLQKAVREMRSHNIGSLVVIDDSGKVVGIITERDIVFQFIIVLIQLFII